MNVIKTTTINVLINCYRNKFRFLKIRKLIKFFLKNERIIVDYYGIKFYVGLNSAIENSILFDEYNEKEILNLVSHFSRLNYNFIDIGANIGIHSLTASHANEKIQIFSFEPEPDNYYNFISNISLNKQKNIKPFCLGVGNIQENKILNINSGWNKGRHSLKIDFGKSENKLYIPIITLDKFIDFFPSQHTLVKIDVEGFENEVVVGGKNTLSSINNGIIIIELLESNNTNDTCNQIIQLLFGYGFNKIYKLENDVNYVEVYEFQGSSDYFLIKSDETLEKFLNFIE